MFLQLIAVLKEKLECGPCADVIVQVDDTDLLAANEGVIDPVQLKTFLRGTIKEWTIMADKFNCRYYQYTIEYDDEQLAEGVTGIDECQVEKICCADCLIDYVDEQFIDEATIASLIDNGDNTFTFDNGLGDTTTIDYEHDLVTGPTPNTVRLVRPDGTFDDVVVEEVSVDVTLPITGDGLVGTPLGILLSTDVDNDLVLGTDSGLYVTVPAALGETVTTLVNNGNNSFTYTSEDATVTTVPFGHTLSSPSTDIIRLTRPNGSFDNVMATVSANLPLTGTGAIGNALDLFFSTDVGNNATIGTDSGLFVSSGAATVSTTLPILGDGSGGNPIDLLISTDAQNKIILGTDSGIYAGVPLTALPIIGDGFLGTEITLFLSTDVGNNATLGTDNGLFVSTGAATVSTTLPITGDGSGGNPVDLLLSTDVGNIAVLGTDSGLYVPTGAVTVSTALPITGDGSGGSPIDLLISVDAGNQVTTGTDGGVFVAIETVVTALPIIGTGTVASPIDLLFSLDAGNVATTGGNGGIHVPTPTVVTALPITGNGSAGSPIDLLISTDANNQLTTGGDGGAFVAIEQVVTALPITGNGTVASPIDLLISTDVGNATTTGTDGGVFTPTPAALPNPGIISVIRSATDSATTGDGDSFTIRHESLGAGATAELSVLIQVPLSWDPATNVEVLARFVLDAIGNGSIRWQWGITSYSIGQALGPTDDQTTSFTQSVVGGAAFQLRQTTSQSILAANLAPGDSVRLSIRRIGADAADTETNSVEVLQIEARFQRLAGDFRVTT